MGGGFMAAFDDEELTHFGPVRVFKYGELKKATNSFTTELGVGGYGSVYLGTLTDGRKVAVKILHDNNPKRLQQFLDEIIVFSRLRHKNLVTLHGCTSPRSKELLLVYDYVPNSTVDDHLHGKRSYLTLAIRVQIAMETAEALVYLHALDPPVIHRDVKTPNIMLDDGFHAKLCDLGLCRLLPWDSTQVLTEAQGTLGYRDPEYDRTCILTVKSDIYSFGMMLVELLSGQMVVDVNRSPGNIYLADFALNKIVNKKLDDIIDPKLGYNNNTHHKRVINSLAELAVKCLHQTGIKRPTMEQVLTELKNIDNELQEKQVSNASLINGTSLIAGLIRRSYITVSLMIIMCCLWHFRRHCTSMIRSLIKVYSDNVADVLLFLDLEQGSELEGGISMIVHPLAIYKIVFCCSEDFIKWHFNVNEEWGEHLGTNMIAHPWKIYCYLVCAPCIPFFMRYFKYKAEGGEHSGTLWITRLQETYLFVLFLVLYLPVALAVALCSFPLMLILCCLWYYTSLTLVTLILILCSLWYYTSLTLVTLILILCCLGWSLVPLLVILRFYTRNEGYRGTILRFYTRNEGQRGRT